MCTPTVQTFYIYTFWILRHSSLPRVPPIPEWNAVYEASFRIARYPRVITLSQVCSWRPTTTRRSVWNRGWPFKNLPPYFVSRSCNYFWEFVSFHARKSSCVPSLRSYGGFQSLQDGVMNITECFPMRKRRSIDKTPGRSHDNSGSSFGNLAILYMNC